MKLKQDTVITSEGTLRLDKLPFGGVGSRSGARTGSKQGEVTSDFPKRSDQADKDRPCLPPRSPMLIKHSKKFPSRFMYFGQVCRNSE